MDEKYKSKIYFFTAKKIIEADIIASKFTTKKSLIEIKETNSNNEIFTKIDFGCSIYFDTELSTKDFEKLCNKLNKPIIFNKSNEVNIFYKEFNNAKNASFDTRYVSKCNTEPEIVFHSLNLRSFKPKN